MKHTSEEARVRAMRDSLGDQSCKTDHLVRPQRASCVASF